MTPIFAQRPCCNIPDGTGAVQQLEQLLAEAGMLRERIASACAGTAASATYGQTVVWRRATPTSRTNAPRSGS